MENGGGKMVEVEYHVGPRSDPDGPSLDEYPRG